jgi:hypothetical protein
MSDVGLHVIALSKRRRLTRQKLTGAILMFFERLDEEQITLLRKIFPDACRELGIGTDEADEERREQLASLILAIAQRESDLDLVLALAVYQLRQPGALH